VCLITKIFLIWWHKIRENCLSFYLDEYFHDRNKLNCLLLIFYHSYITFGDCDARCWLFIVSHHPRACGVCSLSLFLLPPPGHTERPSSEAWGGHVTGCLPMGCEYRELRNLSLVYVRGNSWPETLPLSYSASWHGAHQNNPWSQLVVASPTWISKNWSKATCQEGTLMWDSCLGDKQPASFTKDI
jgi:hypothetical protein